MTLPVRSRPSPSRPPPSRPPSSGGGSDLGNRISSQVQSAVHGGGAPGSAATGSSLHTQLRDSIVNRDSFEPRASRAKVDLSGGSAVRPTMPSQGTAPVRPATPTQTTSPAPTPTAPTTSPAAPSSTPASAPSGTLDTTGPDPEVDGWIAQAEQQMGRDFTASEEEAIRIVAYHESTNTPSAVNNRPDDVNAQIGDNSVGLMQLTKSNFARLNPGGDPMNPVDSIVAAVRYSDERYGGIDKSKGVLDYLSGTHPVGPYGEDNDGYTWY